MIRRKKEEEEEEEQSGGLLFPHTHHDTSKANEIAAK